MENATDRLVAVDVPPESRHFGNLSFVTRRRKCGCLVFRRGALQWELNLGGLVGREQAPSDGAATEPNRAPACDTCNRSKGARTPQEWRRDLKKRDKYK
jgi:hypothetical protein